MFAIRLFLALLILAITASAQTLDDIRDQLRQGIRDTKYMKSSTGLIALVDELELSGMRLTIRDGEDDETSISTLVLPVQRSFFESKDDPIGLYLEGVAGYATARQTIPDLYDGNVPALATRVDLKWRTFGGLVGIGPEFRLSKEWTLALIANAGLARIENEGEYSGPGADVTAAFADGIAFNWDAMSWVAGGAMRAKWMRKFHKEYEARFIARYDLRWTGVFAADDEAQEFTSRAQVVTLRADLVGPAGFTIAGGEVYWRITTGYRRYLEGSLYGERDFFELGGGLELDIVGKLPIGSRVNMSGAIFIGENTEGWTLGAGFNF